MANRARRFYKEELAGETANYVHNRATVSEQSPMAVLAQVTAEAKGAYDRITTALQASGSEEGLQAWDTFVDGYL